MNHFTPFIPAAVTLDGTPRPKSSSRDIETRLLESTRLPEALQRRAEALALLALSFSLVCAAALQVAP